MADERLPLDLSVEVTSATGTKYRWDPSDKDPGNRLRNVSFSTKLGEGFSSLQGQLARRIDMDYPDLSLVDDVKFIGADGSIAWEGRISALPRELTDAHSIGVTGTGWMAHARDKQFREVYVDRDLSAWSGMSLGRQGTMLGALWNVNDGQQASDVATATAGIVTAWNGAWASPFKPLAEAWYDIGPGTAVGKIAYSWLVQPGGVDPANANFSWSVIVASDDKGTGSQGTGNLRAVGPGAGTFTPTVAYRYALLQHLYNVTPGGSDGSPFGIAWYNLAIYGNHGLTTHPGEPGQPEGVYASDVIRNIATRFCPLLDVSGVQNTSYVIQHLTFKDLTDPYDAFLQVNKYHLWQLAVWENKRLTFQPYDLTDYDWEIRTDEPGVTFSPQGPSIDDLCGGITVSYQDALTGVSNVLTPDVYTDLKVTDPENPWIRHGIDNWQNISLSTPTTQAQALQLGRAALADRNTPKTPGTITVKGYIRDRQGVEQPAWRVRAGDTISVTNFPNDTPRLVVETGWDDESKTLSLSIDRPFALIDAYLDRLSTAVTARGLG